MDLLGFESYEDLKDAHCKWVESAIQADNRIKVDKWTQSIAVGSNTFIKLLKEGLGRRAKGRKVIGPDDYFELREVLPPYGKAGKLYSGVRDDPNPAGTEASPRNCRTHFFSSLS